jgi:PAS domain S-box-containing protein
LRLQPDGERSQYFPVLFLGPLDARTSPILGYDQWTDPVRQEAMQLARDSGQAAATRPVRSLVISADESANRIAVFVPFFRAGQPAATVAERDAALNGFVYSELLVNKLLEGVFTTDPSTPVGARVSDGSGSSGEALLYTDPPDGLSTPAPRFSQTISVRAIGRTWNIELFTLPTFDADSAGSPPRTALLIGLVGSILLFAITWTQTRGRRVAEQMTQELRRSQLALLRSRAEFEAMFKSMSASAVLVDASERIALINPAVTKTFGYLPGEIVGKSPGVLYADGETDAPSSSSLGDPDAASPMEAPFRHKDGSLFLGEVQRSPVEDINGTVSGRLELIQDITERSSLENQFRQAQKMEAVGLLAGASRMTSTISSLP